MAPLEQTATIIGHHTFFNAEPPPGGLQDALQIQYFVQLLDWGKVGMRAYNIYVSGTSDAKDMKCVPQHMRGSMEFATALFPALKLLTMKQWVLASLWLNDDWKDRLSVEVKALLSGYILYFEKVLDAITAYGRVPKLKQWVRVEYHRRGDHTLAHESGPGPRDLKGFVLGQLQEWRLKAFYPLSSIQIHRLKDNAAKRDQVFGAVVQWLERTIMERENRRAATPSTSSTPPLSIARPSSPRRSSAPSPSTRPPRSTPHEGPRPETPLLHNASPQDSDLDTNDIYATPEPPIVNLRTTAKPGAPVTILPSAVIAGPGPLTGAARGAKRALPSESDDDLHPDDRPPPRQTRRLA